MGLYDRPPRRKRLNKTDLDRYDGREAAEAPDPDRGSTK
jgi:hypothetical protein